MCEGEVVCEGEAVCEGELVCEGRWCVGGEVMCVTCMCPSTTEARIVAVVLLCGDPSHSSGIRYGCVLVGVS